MFDLSPTKLLIILAVAVVLVGPKRLPDLARQAAAGWRRMQQLRGDIEREVRHTVPDLPAGAELVRYARSPLTILDRLAQMPPAPATVALVADRGAPDPVDATDTTLHPGGTPRRWPEDAGAAAVTVAEQASAVRRDPSTPDDDPGLN